MLGFLRAYMQDAFYGLSVIAIGLSALFVLLLRIRTNTGEPEYLSRVCWRIFSSLIFLGPIVVLLLAAALWLQLSS
jgi:hypothetical protein